VSAGYAPQTDEEKLFLQQQQQDQTHGPTDASVPPPPQTLLASADNFTNLNAPPQSQVSGGLPAGQTFGQAIGMPAAAPPPQVPPVSPVPVPATPLPLAPKPHAGPRPQTPGGGFNTTGEEQQIYQNQKTLDQQAVKAEQDAGAARKELAQTEATGAQDEATRLGDTQRQQADVIDAANKRTQAWADRAQAESDKYMKMDYRDYWSDKSTGNKVLAGIAMLTGALGRTNNKDNPGMNMINDAIERDFRMQQARIEKQKTNVSEARAQYQTGLEQKQQDLADNKLKEAAAYNTAAAKLTALKMKQGMSLEQAKTDGDVVALKQKGQQTVLATLKDIHGQHVQDEQLKLERQKVGIEQQNASNSRDRLKMDKQDRKDASEQKRQDAFDARTVRDENGNPVGMASSTRTVAQYGKDIAASKSYMEKVDELAKHIEKHGRILNPYSDDAKERQSLMAEVQSLGRQVSGIQASDAGQKLEHEMIGGSGIGLSSTANPSVLRALAAHAHEKTMAQLRSSLTPMSGQSGIPEAGGTPPVQPTRSVIPTERLTDKDRALRIQAKQVVGNPKADPALKRDAQAYLDATGG
jgi:hypothetical protein